MRESSRGRRNGLRGGVGCGGSFWVSQSGASAVLGFDSGGVVDPLRRSRLWVCRVTLGSTGSGQVGGVNPYPIAPVLAGICFSPSVRRSRSGWRRGGRRRRSPGTWAVIRRRSSGDRAQQSRAGDPPGQASPGLPGPVGRYRADERAHRPKALRTQASRGCENVWVQTDLDQHWSPEQISNRLRVDFPDDQGMQVSHVDDLQDPLRAGPRPAPSGSW